MILFENRRDEKLECPGILFKNPRHEVVCTSPSDVCDALDEIDALREEGYYLAGMLSYEACYALFDLKNPWDSSDVPLIHFFAFDKPEYLTNQSVSAYLGYDMARIHSLQLNATNAQYIDQFNRVQHHLKRGDTYQVNLTTKYAFQKEGSSRGLYNRLRARQRVAYSALIECAEYEVLSLSPELFFSKTNQTMQARPMKGTMPRVLDDSARDAFNANFLRTDEKSRAENTIIVDLLRNDLARISEPGSVKVPHLLQVESYETVHQMTSSLESVVDEEIPFSKIVKALFPCGSITGAPKKRTIELIAEIEGAPRGVYTGAIGYITPENNMCFNVPIRTVYCKGSHAELGVGGGIVYDSTADAEYEEVQLKARFLTGLME